MSEEEIRKIFSENLNYFLKLNNKTPVDLVNDLKLPFSTVSNWCNGLKMPRMGNVELLAKYFHVEKSDLIERHNNKKEYYLNDETRQIAQKIFENRELRMLFDTTKNAPPEDLNLIIEMVKRMKLDEQ